MIYSKESKKHKERRQVDDNLNLESIYVFTIVNNVSVQYTPNIYLGTWGSQVQNTKLHIHSTKIINTMTRYNDNTMTHCNE